VGNTRISCLWSKPLTPILLPILRQIGRAILARMLIYLLPTSSPLIGLLPPSSPLTSSPLIGLLPTSSPLICFLLTSVLTLAGQIPAGWTPAG
jgi:hypothetical protein